MTGFKPKSKYFYYDKKLREREILKSITKRK